MTPAKIERILMRIEAKLDIICEELDHLSYGIAEQRYAVTQLTERLNRLEDDHA